MKPEDSRSNLSLEDPKQESPVAVTHGNRKSHTDAASTEPEIIETPDLKSDSEAKDSQPEDATAPSVHIRSTAGESSTSTPPSSAGSGDSTLILH
jgi:hypothetical protein